MQEQIERLFTAMGTTWSNDPDARGVAKMTTGALLVAAGLFGGSAGSKTGDGNASGLGSTLVGVLFAVGMFAMSGLLKPDLYDSEKRTTGTIVDVRTSIEKGREHYSAVYSFDADGRAYRFTSPSNSSIRPTVGKKVEIAYSATNPNNARRTDGMEGAVYWIVFGMGGVLLLLMLTDLFIALLLIGVGIWLFTKGRADRRSVGVTGNFFADLMKLGRPSKADGTANNA